MMKTVLMLIVMTMCYPAKGQVFLIKPSLASCVKCDLKLESSFNIARTGIPTYLVFSASASADSTEIEKSLKYKEKGIRLEFSDKLLRYFKGDHDVVYLSNAGNALQKNLYTISDDDIDAIKEAYEKDFKFLSTPSKIYKYDGGNLLAIDEQLSSASLTNGRDTFTYKVTEELQVKIKNKISALYPGIFATTEKYIIEKPRNKFLLKPSQGSFVLHGSDVYLNVRMAYFDSVGYDAFNVNRVHVLVRFHRDSCAIYPIHIPYLVNPKYLAKGYKIPSDFPNTFYGRTPVIKNDSTLIYTLADSKNPRPGNPNKFLAEFRLKNGVVTFDHELDIDLPELYKQDNIGYPDPYTYTSLYRVDYPFYTTAVYPSLIDLSREKSYDYQVPFATKVPDSVKLKVEICPLNNFYVFNDPKRKQAYIHCMINGRMSLQILAHGGNASLKKVVDLQSLGIVTEPTDYFQIIPEKEIVYAADGAGYVRTYPLDLLLGE